MYYENIIRGESELNNALRMFNLSKIELDFLRSMDKWLYCAFLCSYLEESIIVIGGYDEVWS